MFFSRDKNSTRTFLKMFKCFGLLNFNFSKFKRNLNTRSGDPVVQMNTDQDQATQHIKRA